MSKTLKQSRLSKILRDILQVIAPNLFAGLLFLGGISLLFSSFTPAFAGRLHWLKNILPIGVIELSHQLSIIDGVLMLFLARAVQLRLDSSYYATLIVLIIGAASSLTKGFDFEETLILGTLFVIFLPTHRFFYRKSALLSLDIPIYWAFAILIAIIGLVSIGFYSYKHIPYSEALWFEFRYSGQASRFLRSLVTLVALSVILGFYRFITLPAKELHYPDNDELERAKEIIASNDDCEGNLALLKDKFLFWNKEQTAFIMFRISGRLWIAMGDPIGKLEDFRSLAWQFRERADLYCARIAFFQVSEDNLRLYLDLGLSLAKLGEEACINLETFTLKGKAKQNLRTTLNKQEKEGVIFEIISKDRVLEIMPKLKEVSDAWLFSKDAKEKRFSMGKFDPEYIKNFDVAIARRGSAILAFSNIWQTDTKNEYAIDLMRYTDEAPKAIMEFLFVSLILWGKEQGFKTFRLGLSPLAGLDYHPLAPIWTKIGNSIFHFGNDFYNFEGLYSFKSKFCPEWKPRYLASYSGMHSASALLISTNLVNGGFNIF